jgi:hypothetical protein
VSAPPISCGPQTISRAILRASFSSSSFRLRRHLPVERAFPRPLDEAEFERPARLEGGAMADMQSLESARPECRSDGVMEVRSGGVVE